MAIIDYKLKVVFVTSETKYGCAFLGTFAFPRARAPRFFLLVPSASIFPSRSAFLYNIFFRFPCAHAFMLCVPSVCLGVGDQLITCAQCVHGLIRLAGSTRHRGVYKPNQPSVFADAELPASVPPPTPPPRPFPYCKRKRVEAGSASAAPTQTKGMGESSHSYIFNSFLMQQIQPSFVCLPLVSLW